MGELYSSYKLSEACRVFIAQNFDDYWGTDHFIEFIKQSPSGLVKDLKDSIEENLVHYGMLPRWEQVEMEWKNLFETSEE